MRAFKPSALTFALISAGVSMTPNVVHAQDTADKDADLEVIEITGMRGSITRSTQVKRNANGVVDSISAEDMGKFPDTNLAESLQRITGVSISRANGEGAQVTVRGFGAEYNMVTLNGRTMPSAPLAVEATGANGSRAFDMSNLASESINAVDVYKTSKANISAGGIGATIDIQTARPLDNPKFKASFGAKALHDTTNETGDDITPELSGIVSWANEEQNFGISASASYQKRDSSSTGAYTALWGYHTQEYAADVAPAGQPLSSVSNITNEPSTGQVFGYPTSYRFIHSDFERERINSQLTLQYRPHEDVDVTLDYTLSQQETSQLRSELAIWMYGGATDIEFDGADVPTPNFLYQDAGAPTDITSALQKGDRELKNDSLGLNIEWHVNDDFTLEFNAHDSTAKGLPNGSYGSWLNQSVGARIQQGAGVDFTTKLPVVVLNFAEDPNLNGNKEYGAGATDISDWGSQPGSSTRASLQTDITQVRLDGSYQLDTMSIDFGVESLSVKNHALQTDFNYDFGSWAVATPGELDGNLLQPINYASLFDDYDLTPSAAGQTFIENAAGPGADLRVMDTGLFGDAEALQRYLFGLDAYSADTGAFPGNQTLTTDRTIEEDTTAVYVQVNYETELGDKPVNILAGLRYEQTDVKAVAVFALPEQLIWTANNDFTLNTGGAVPVAEESDYDHLLPSIDLDIELTDDIKARASYNKTIARAAYDQLSPNVGNYGAPNNPGALGGGAITQGTASSGNPSLLPLESDNFDISIEWYYAEDSYVSVGYFNKDTANFPGLEAQQMSLFGLTNPSDGPLAQAALAQLQANGVPLTDTNLFSQAAANQAGADVSSKTDAEWEVAEDIVNSSNDELVIFNVTRPVNNKDATVYGFELAAQHFFADTGFGVQANYTIVEGDVDFDDTAEPGEAQFALLGLSDTANLVLMYENHGISGRIAFNWRDAFLNNNNFSGRNGPEYTDSYSQIDISIGYQFSDNLSVSFEGLNITDEDSYTYGRTKNMHHRLDVLGARYAVSARYTF